MLGLDPSLPSRGFDGVAGAGGAPDAAAAAAAAVLEDGRGGGGASPVSLVRETIVCVDQALCSLRESRFRFGLGSCRFQILRGRIL